MGNPMASVPTAADRSQLLTRLQKAADDFADVFAVAVGYFPVGEESARREWVNGFRGPMASSAYRWDGTRHGRSGSPWHYLIVRHHSQPAARLVDATRRLERIAQDHCHHRGGQWLPFGLVDFLDAIRPADDSPVWDYYTSPDTMGGGCNMRVTAPAPADRHRFTIVDNPFDMALELLKSDEPKGGAESLLSEPSRCDTALAILFSNPNITKSEIAGQIRVTRQALSENKEFETFREVWDKTHPKNPKRKSLSIPHGYKSADGDIEAADWDED